jgi:hypothetical protein
VCCCAAGESPPRRSSVISSGNGSRRAANTSFPGTGVARELDAIVAARSMPTLTIVSDGANERETLANLGRTQDQRIAKYNSEHPFRTGIAPAIPINAGCKRSCELLKIRRRVDSTPPPCSQRKAGFEETRYDQTGPVKAT